MSEITKPWRSWNAPFDRGSAHRKMCGLLNKLNTSNFDSLAPQIVHWTTSCGRCGNVQYLHTMAQTIVLRAVTDSVRSVLYARLCRKIGDDLDKEDEDWMFSTDDANPSYIPSFPSILHDVFAETRPVDVRLDQPVMHEAFVADLLLYGVLSPKDVQEQVDDLLSHAEQGEEQSAMSLSRLFRRITRVDEAGYLLQQLNLLHKTGKVLEEDTLTPRARYLLMAAMDSVQVGPVDVFDSMELRNEIYNLEDLDNEL
ncbi:hypothetical protein BJ138DRAFT_39290 [Hygrophoropsis aurantiaca]|uniref:Uncharacterized protein n=1 Tax=Hygrophoropsis aurantiaca TaxID=72124 RepID=A0ACB8ACZ3_9AGAM|nr:hypothetical protein BJ138DRAFT_39290 [Hygrophoropsis aurantiaca]